ncbi:MAG: HAMP domain-containing sensor histidine kinase [Rhizomicrobium sp.]
MKRILFWKILIAFWITFLISTQVIWLMFLLTRPSEQSTYVRDIADRTIAAATSAIKRGGDQELRIQRDSLPRDRIGRLEVYRDTGKPDPRPALARTIATGPDGTRYSLSYYQRDPPRRGGLFGIPHEVLIVELLGGLAFSAVLAWYLTKPVHRMRAGFGSLAQGDFSTRLGPSMGRRRDEIADLAHDFDKMAARLEELVAARDRLLAERDQLLADVSHELRTPLARLNLAIGLARQDPAKLDASLDRIRGEAVKLDDMVGELLTLTKLESGQKPRDDYFNFAEVVRAVIQDARFEASAKQLDIALTLDPSDETFEWIAQGDGKLISRAIENIVRNSLRYSPAKGKVLADLRFADGTYKLTVTDEGPGIPKEQLGGLFRPFGVSADGFGFGLGLSIAHRALAVHGGTIALSNRQPRGLETRVTIPAAG